MNEAAQDWRTLIEASSSDFTKVEAELVEYINLHPERLCANTLNDFSLHSGYSKPLIIRCFRKLGLEDYRSLQSRVEAFFSSQLDALNATRLVHKKAHNTEQLIREAIAVDQRSIERCAQTIDPKKLEHLVTFIEQASKIFVVGAGTGSFPAHYLAQRLIRYGLSTIALESGIETFPDRLMGASPKDLLVLFHYSDDDGWLSPYLSFAREREINVVLVSGTIHPDYIGSSREFFHIPRGELQFKNSMAVPMFFANLILLEYELIFQEKSETNLEELARSRQLWNRERQGRAAKEE